MISQTIEYALRAMNNLASLGGAATTSEAIAKSTRIPQAYLSKIMRDLVLADLVRSFRGPHGGFVLARDAEAITLLDIVNAVDPIRRMRACPMEDPPHTDPCPLHQCLADCLAHLEERFRTTTLGSMGSAAPGASDSHGSPTPPPTLPSKEPP